MILRKLFKCGSNLLGWFLAPPTHYIRESISNILTKVGVPEEEHSTCLSWAFGDDYASIEIRFLDDRWRDLHPDRTIICGSTPIVEAFRIVGEEYLKSKEAIVV